jgi:flagellar hook-associated protein 2
VTLETEPDNSAHTVLGLSNGVSETGLDVEGTINGESATGNGQYLTGDDGNENTDGLRLLITLTADQLGDGAEAVVTFNKGIASILNEKFTSYIDPYEGILKRKKDTIESQIDMVTDQIKSIEEQLERKRASLYRQFIAMEEALGQLQAQQQYLTSTIAGLNNNWIITRRNN